MTKGRRIGNVLAGVLAASVAQAHHGVAKFDLNRDIELEGIVSRVDFINPHSWLPC